MTKNHQSNLRNLFENLLAGNCLECRIDYVVSALEAGYLPIYDTRLDAYFESFEGIFVSLNENRMLVMEYDGEVTPLSLNFSSVLARAYAIVVSRDGNGHE